MKRRKTTCKCGKPRRPSGRDCKACHANAEAIRRISLKEELIYLRSLAKQKP